MQPSSTVLHPERDTSMIDLKVAGGVATITLDSAPVNAISEQWMQLFNARLDELESRSDWTVLHIRSARKVFCAGADLKQMDRWLEGQDGPDRMYSYVACIQRLYSRIEQLPQVSLAEISGAALGGGFELALACDLRIAASDAKVGLPEARLGLIPGAGGTQRLTRLCNRSVAARLILGAEVLDGASACALGIVHWAVPKTELSDRAVEIAKRVAQLAPAALAASKACIVLAAQPGRGGYSEELEATRELLSNPETRRRVRAFLDGSQRNNATGGSN